MGLGVFFAGDMIATYVIMLIEIIASIGGGTNITSLPYRSCRLFLKISFNQFHPQIGEMVQFFAM